jgi:triacylglycerol lipase
MRKALRIIGLEAHAWARQGQLMLMGGRHRKEPSGERVVAFVHGYAAAGAVFDPLRSLVEERLGVETVEFTYLPTESFTTIVDRLSERLDRIAARSRIDLVGHSLGGLISRWYLQELGGARHVDRLITLATPHAGTRSAKVALGPLRSALLPNGNVVRRLSASRAAASGVAHTALVAGADLMVSPPASAAAIEDAAVHWFDELGHNAMLYADEVHEVVLGALSAGGER